MKQNEMASLAAHIYAPVLLAGQDLVKVGEIVAEQDGVPSEVAEALKNGARASIAIIPQGPLLVAEALELKRGHTAVWSAVQQLPATTDPIKFVNILGQILDPMSDTISLLEQMEDIRHQHSKMRRY
jgi:hypothetical protein